MLNYLSKDGSSTVSFRAKLTDNPVKRGLVKYSLVMSVVMMLASILSLAGWMFSAELLLNPWGTLDAMNPMSAVSWLLLGLCLWLHVHRNYEKQYLTAIRLLSLVGIVIGGLRILEIVTGVVIGVDQFLFPEKQNIYIKSGDISLLSALSMLCIGTALLLSSFNSKRIRRTANIIASLVFAAGLFSLIGNAYQVEEVTGFLWQFSMSSYAAIVFILISSAVVFLNNDVGFMLVFTSPYLGGVIARLLIPLIILVPLFLGFVWILAEQNLAVSEEFGISVLIISIMMVFFGLIWYLSSVLSRSDIARTAAETQLKKINEKLELEVAERTEEIVKSEKRFRSLIENNDAIIALVDREFKTTYRTPSSEKISGWADDERRNTNAMNLVHPDDKELVLQTTQKAEQNPGKPFNLTFRLRNSDGSYIWLQGTITNMYHDPIVNAIIINFRDITARKVAEEEVKKLNEELEQKVEERTAELKKAIQDLESFSYTISHDLRSPLQVINSYASLLAQKRDACSEEKAQNILREIKNYTHQMSDTIESLLNLSLSGRIEMVKENVDVNKLVQKVINELKIIYKDIPAEIKVHPLAPSHCDEGLIKLVWRNLLSNAIKYSAKSESPIVEVGSKTQEDEIIYYVIDNGIGFKTEDTARLFDVFYRLGNASDFEGSGLGLAIVHRIVIRHGGRVWAEPNKEQGAAFYFTLPIQP